MAGAGARLFPANSKLTSTQVNTFLMDQTIMRFATTAARDAAFGGVGEPTLAEGMTAYIDADNSIYTYDGSNWVKMVSTSDRQSIGLWAVTPSSVAGTGVTVSGSTVTMAGTGSVASLNGVFTNEYRQYRIIINHTINNQVLYFRLRSAGSDASGSNYSYVVAYNAFNGGGGGNFNGINLTTNVIGYGDVNTTSIVSIDVTNPALALPTNTTGTAAWSGASGHVGGYHNLFTAYDGFTIFAVSGVMSGQINVYGYR
jgi:hypothetical protein